jgi:hypothetical protein
MWKNPEHCKKEFAVFPSPAGMSLIKLFLGGNNLFFSRLERVWSVTSRLGTGKQLTLSYSEGIKCVFPLFSDPFDVVRESPAAFGKSSGGSCLTIFRKAVLNDVY